MGHLGLTPQFVNAFGGMKVQARTQEEQDKLKSDAMKLQSLGAFALVLECIPSSIAQEISKTLQIPTIGIGAGPYTDGQVLVLQDLLGFDAAFNPKFLRKYLNGQELFLKAFNQFHQDVRECQFPNDKETYT
jgi:3-methyl-2-oxobutanoate hydroxymethyltransferase